MIKSKIQKMQESYKEKYEELQKIKKELRDAEYEERQALLIPLRNLTEKFHDLACTYNHTDGCGWQYEKNNWDGTQHRRWLEHVDKMVNEKAYYNKITVEMLSEIIDYIAPLKKKYPSLLYILKNIVPSSY